MKHATSYTGDFRCMYCRQPVAGATWLAGVHNRNHCPYCLFSRHMDLYKSGDRLAACRSEMQPVGLALKKRHNKYTAVAQGELMIAHLCLGCGKISLNRIAADDDNQGLLSLLNPPDPLRQQVTLAGVQLLGQSEARVVKRVLFGAHWIYG